MQSSKTMGRGKWWAKFDYTRVFIQSTYLIASHVFVINTPFFTNWMIMYMLRASLMWHHSTQHEWRNWKDVKLMSNCIRV
jgi:hypothetical protein